MNTAGSGKLPVVAGVDGSAAALEAVRWAAWEAENRHEPLQLVHALGLDDMLAGMTLPPGQGLREQLRARGWQVLRDAKQAADESSPVAADLVLETGTPVPTLLAACRQARMIVVGSAGRGGFLAGMALGSTAAQVAAHSECPVVVVRGPGAERIGTSAPVVVGIDGSPLSEAALAYAFEEASLRSAPLVAVNAWTDADTTVLFSQVRAYFDYEPVRQTQTRLLAERLAGWREKYPDVDVERVVVEDKPRHQLIELSDTAQLIVVGSRGRGGIPGALLGSVSRALVHHAACPVMVVKPGPG